MRVRLDDWLVEWKSYSIGYRKGVRGAGKWGGGGGSLVGRRFES